MPSLTEFSQQQNIPQNQATTGSRLSDFMSKFKGSLPFFGKKKDKQVEIKKDKFEFGTKPKQFQTQESKPQSLSDFSQEKPARDEKKSALKSSFKWIGKQLMKPVGITAKEFRGVGEAIGSLMAIASPRVSAEKGMKIAAERFVLAQKGAWDVLRGKEETDFLREMADAGIKISKLDKVLGLGANIVLDPLWIAKPVKIVKGLAKITKLDKPIKAGAKVVSEIPKVKQLKSLFTTTTGNKKFDDIVKKFRSLKEAREGDLIDDAVKLQKDIKGFVKEGIKNADELIVEGLENRASLYKAIPKTKTVKKVGEEIVGKVPKVDPRIIEKVDQLKNTYSGLLERAKKVGLKVGEIQEYAPRIITKEAFATRIKKEFGLGAREFGKGSIEAKTQAFLEFTGKSGKKITGTAKGLKLKNYDYINTAGKITKEYKPGHRINSFVDDAGEVFKITGRQTQKKIGLIEGGKYAKLYEKSPAIQLAVKGQAYAKAITSQEFAQTVKKFAIKDGGVAVKHNALKGLNFLPEQAKVIDNYYQSIKPEELKVIVKGFDKVQNLWKAQALVSPSYHIRNEVGNLWNNYIAGVNPWAYGKATYMQIMPKLKNFVDKRGYVKISSKMDDAVKNIAKEVNEMRKLGVIDQGWYAKDIGEEVLQRVQGVGKFQGLNPLNQQNYLFQLNKKTGTAIENNARIAHYLSKRAGGMSKEKAAESVKKYLFDYGDLTSFEKTVMKRFAPFYTWTKKNIPIQLEGLITQPAKYALPHKIIKQIESGVEVPDEKYMSSYITENVPVRVRKNKEGNTEYFLLGNWLPYASAIDVLSHPIETIVQMATPFLKTPIEQWSNQSTFWKNTLGEYQDIERRPGQQGEFMGEFMRKKNVQLLRNIRILNDINKWIDKQDPTATKNEWPVKVMETLFGRAGTYDVGKSKYFYDMDTSDRISDFESNIKDAKRKGYDEKARKLREELIEFQQTRR